MRKFLILLLLPSMLWAGTLTIKTPEGIQQPAGTIDRVSKRTQFGKVFERDSIGSGKFIAVVGIDPVHYLDPAGVYRNLDYAILDTVIGIYTHRIKPGKFAFDFNEDGRFRYVAKQGQIAFTPTFSLANIDLEFSFGPNGMKANYILKNASAPDSLVWNWLVTPDTMVWKGVITNAKIKAWMDPKLVYPTAQDANGDTLHVERTATGSTMSYKINTAGAVYPVTVDPSIQDTIVTARTRIMNNSADPFAGPWLTGRNSATDANSASNAWAAGQYTRSNWRTAVIFSLTEYNIAGVIVDSTRFFMYTDGSRPGNDSLMVHAVIGTFTGASATGWYNDFYGWGAAGVYTPTYLTATALNFKFNASAQWQSGLFTAEGNDTLEAKFTADSLRVMLLSTADIAGDSLLFGTYIDEKRAYSATAPYLKIYYRANQAGVTTVSDTSRAAAVLTANIDSLGGANVTARGFKYWLKGSALSADTVTITKSGSFLTGAYLDSTQAVLVDTLYRYKAYVTNAFGTSYGAIDSFTTYGDGTIMVDGRAVGGIH